MLVFATPLTFAALGGMFSERSGVVNIGLEGMMLVGAFFGIWGADKTGSWVLGVLIAMVAGGLLALVHAFFAIHLRGRSDRRRHGDQLPRARHHRLFLLPALQGQDTPSLSRDPESNLHVHDRCTTSNFGPAFGKLNYLMIWAELRLVVLSYVVMFKTPIGLRIRACGEHPRAADTVGINVYAVRYASVVLSGMLAAMGGAYLSVGFVRTRSTRT